jgi:hypothetical protein
MRCNGFASTLVFGAAAAAGLVLATGLLVPPFRWGSVAAVYLVAAAALYVAGIAPSRSRGVLAGGLAAALGLLLLLVAGGLRELAIGAALVVSVCRSGVLYQARPARAIATEAGLCVGGLALAGFLASGGVASAALGLWGYFLVQSVFFLVAGVSARAHGAARPDPFDRARAQLLDLLREDAR